MKLEFALTVLCCAAAVALAVPAAAQDHGRHHSPYAGQESRAIKTLSAQDIDDLRNGRGWGFAKAAELNGVPGPSHLLEMKDAIALTADQVAAIRREFNDMRQKAKDLGERFVALERGLNEGFASGAMTEALLAARLAQIADTRRRLRQLHLAAHLRVRGVLSAAQIARYNRLRGYRPRRR